MSSSKDDDDYWYSSERHSFCFENNEEDKLFGVSKTGTARLRAGISNINLSENLRSEDTQKNLKPLLSVISEKTLNDILAANKPQSTSEDFSTMQSDITLRRILLGQTFSLERYKSLASKITLLDAAITSGDGNAILIIVLFIIKTLKRSLIQRLLIERPEAIHVYVRYLSTRLQTNELTDLLTMLGRSTDAAMRNIQIILKNTPNPERLLQKLQSCYKTQFSSLPDCRESSFVRNYIELLEWQAAVKSHESQKSFQLNSSVLECLRYACRDHWGTSEGTAMSPVALSRQHAISPRQYQKVALITRASLQAWDDVELLLVTKGWLGSKKLQTCLPVDDILKILQECQAPSVLLEKFLLYIDNLTKRLEIAKKLQCHRAIIDIFVQQGDRTALLKYKVNLHQQSEENFYAKNALCLPSTKWKN